MLVRPASACLHLRPWLRYLPQRKHVHFGVNLRSQEGTMAEHASDILQGYSLPQHTAGNRVTEDVRPRVRVPSSPPFKFKDLPEVLSFPVGTKRHKMGTSRHQPFWTGLVATWRIGSKLASCSLSQTFFCTNRPISGFSRDARSSVRAQLFHLTYGR
jgi:hypothetical protein